MNKPLPIRDSRLEELANWKGTPYQEEAYQMAEELKQLRENYDNAIAVLREWPMGHPRLEAAMKEYQVWCDYVDSQRD